MDFEKAYEYVSGSITKQELQADIDANIEQMSLDATRLSTDVSVKDRQSKKKDDTFLKVGWYQILLVFLLGLGINSGSWIIFPLAYLELEPDFKCLYEDSHLAGANNHYWATCAP